MANQSQIPVYGQFNTLVNEGVATAEWGKSFISRYGIFFVIALVFLAVSKVFKINLKT